MQIEDCCLCAAAPVSRSRPLFNVAQCAITDCPVVCCQSKSSSGPFVSGDHSNLSTKSATHSPPSASSKLSSVTL